MIFQHTIDKVLSGEKTMTRRIVKAGQRYQSDYATKHGYAPAVVDGKGRLVWLRGYDYAVSAGRGKKGVARIRITGIRREDVRHISEADVKAEGFRDRYHFMQTWASMWDKKFQLDYYDGIIWQFKGVGDSNCYSEYPREGFVEGNFKAALMSRPSEFYQAWAITFCLVEGK